MMSLGYLKGRLGEIKLANRLLEYILHTKFYHCWYYHHRYLPSNRTRGTLWYYHPFSRQARARAMSSHAGCSPCPIIPRQRSAVPGLCGFLIFLMKRRGGGAGFVLFCCCFVSRWATYLLCDRGRRQLAVNAVAGLPQGTRCDVSACPSRRRTQ